MSKCSYFSGICLVIVLKILLLNGLIMAAKKDLLKEYNKKRDFKKTTEPQGLKKVKLLRPIYVIQKHNASHLHYDLRLEMDGVLKSWAVPKGPSLDPEIKRLAVETEDHPIDYANFEGVIPEGYGAGTVMVWDIGTFKNLKPDQSIEQDYENGKLEVYLEGKKLKGAFVLIKTHLPGSGKANWLLKKMALRQAQDDRGEVSLKKDPIKTQDKSVLTNRTTDQIASAYVKTTADKKDSQENKDCSHPSTSSGRAGGNNKKNKKGARVLRQAQDERDFNNPNPKGLAKPYVQHLITPKKKLPTTLKLRRASKNL